MITATEKIKIILNRKHMTIAELADRVGISRQNLSNKMARNNFQEKDIQEMASALGYDISIEFIDKKTGERI